MTISNIISKATGQVVTRFWVEPLGAEGTKTNMVAMPVYDKIFKKFVLLNQRTDGLET